MNTVAQKIPTDVATKIEGVLRKLPSMWPTGLQRLPLDAMAEKYEFMLSPEVVPPAKGETKELLDRIGRSAASLLEAMQSVRDTDVVDHFHARRPRSSAPSDLFPTWAKAQKIAEFLERFARTEIELINTSGPDKRKGRSRPVNVALNAARDFYFITGCEPSRSGKNTTIGLYTPFLAEVLRILLIHSSVEDVAKRALALWKKERPSHPDLFPVKGSPAYLGMIAPGGVTWS